MARYTDPVCRICRREGLKLFLKGARCYSRKCSFERRSTPPGMNTQRRRKVSEFGIQLREKQKVRKTYSVLEKQFRNYFEKAEQRKGMTGENLLRMLEMRLDNVVYRMGLARSRAEARQLVNHGHFTVNGRPTNIPSYRHQGRRPDRGPREPPRSRVSSRPQPSTIKRRRSRSGSASMRPSWRVGVWPSPPGSRCRSNSTNSSSSSSTRDSSRSH